MRLGMVLRRFSNRKVRGWVHPELGLPACLTNGWNASPEIPGAELLLDCKGRRMYRAPLDRAGRSESCFIYLFRNQSFSRSLQRTHAFHILQIAETMRGKGIQTLEVLAALKPRNERLNWHSLLIASEIDSVNELPSAGNHVFQVHESVRFDKGLASCLAGELSTFHNRKFVHGDLKSRHILARQNSTESFSGNGVKRFHLVDLEKSKYYPLVPDPLLDVLAARDLVQLFASLPNGQDLDPVRSQFLSEYFSGRKLSKLRIGLIRRILDLYSPGGSLRQGSTILENLIARVGGRQPKS